ncbi:hypothetical protein SAMN06265338_14018 [Rhodoblastus acidophilus]|uniref:Uncharacterized protein n=1 Tax=Rhodoblastus acidophilus TaxID=1074 RepID=A0A212SGN9_RHOAC|nr:hypothetical protein [Rhodoblastus acidophilus]PPQ34763.1 hypothetical protein CKO16_22070 [Rhodoblastus acidophilus]RAI16536.1 hypothetical protein CH337_20775 [Rhodoblastus acidophilus]SNB84888.1 hypothetical protein SAMN06265338_14018 [Rhodoblastus acidophilus]
MIPDLPLRTPFERSIHARHVGVNGPWLSGTWAISIEPQGHPTIRDALLIRLTPEQVRFLLGAILGLDRSLFDTIPTIKAECDSLDQVVRALSEKDVQLESRPGTPSETGVPSGNDVDNSRHNAEAAS